MRPMLAKYFESTRTHRVSLKRWLRAVSEWGMMANNYGVSRRTLLGVGGLMLGVGLVGCSDSEEGWESVTVDRITVSHPTEWVEKPPENENFTKNFTDGPHGMQIAGHYSDDTEPTLAWSVLEFMIRGTFQGYDPKGYQEITVKGAARAIKCPFDFTYKGKSARGYWLVASGVLPTEGSAIVLLRLPRDDTNLVDKIIASMSFKA